MRIGGALRAGLVALTERWNRSESRRKLAKRLLRICLAGFVAAMLIVAAVNRTSCSSVEREPPFPHKTCEECQRLLLEHGIQLPLRDFAGCSDKVHVAADLKRKKKAK